LNPRTGNALYILQGDQEGVAPSSVCQVDVELVRLRPLVDVDKEVQMTKEVPADATGGKVKSRRCPVDVWWSRFGEEGFQFIRRVVTRGYFSIFVSFPGFIRWVCESPN